MTVEKLLNVPQTQEAWLDWSFANAQCIAEIRQAITAQKGITLTDYVLYPINWLDLQNWLLRSQQSHNDFNDALNLSGVNLQDANLEDPRERPSFIFNNWIEINNAREALKI